MSIRLYEYILNYMQLKHIKHAIMYHKKDFILHWSLKTCYPHIFIGVLFNIRYEETERGI